APQSARGRLPAHAAATLPRPFARRDPAGDRRAQEIAGAGDAKGGGGERGMEDNDRELEQDTAERKLEASAARLRPLQAKAEERHAAGALGELSGIASLEQRIRRQFDEWKRADKASWQGLVGAVREGLGRLAQKMDATDARLDRVDEATDACIDAEL